MNFNRITVLLLLVFVAVSAFAHSTGWGNTSYCGNPPLSRYCVECHDNFALNSGGGSLSLTGLPTGGYTPGQTYTLVVHLAQQGQQRWGFQLTSVKSSNPGRKGGQLINTDAINTALGVTGGILPDYENHTSAGTRAGTLNGPVTFTFNWQAPVANTGTILFYYVGNAANNSDDPNGDYIYAHVDSVMEAISNHPPSSFALISPHNDSVLTSTSVTLNWQTATDQDAGDTVRYVVYYGTDSTFAITDSSNTNTVTSYLLSNLTWGTDYYWKVTAYDPHNARTNSSQMFHFATMNYSPPTAPELLSPEDQSLISTDTVRFHWSGGVNPDSGYFILTLQSGNDTTNYTIHGSREILVQIDTVPGYAINTAMMWSVTALSNYTSDRAVSSTFTLLPVVNAVHNAILPKSLSLSEPSPNPFNPETKLSLTLPTEAVVHGELFDINGRLVSFTRWGTLSAGTHNLTIRPEVGSGVYFLRLAAGNQLFIRRLALIK